MNIGWMVGNKENIQLIADLLNDKFVKHPKRFQGGLKTFQWVI